MNQRNKSLGYSCVLFECLDRGEGNVLICFLTALREFSDASGIWGGILLNFCAVY